jgi:hypothetical protein
VQAVDPEGDASEYGEDPAMVEAYAKGLGLAYQERRGPYGKKFWECEEEKLPNYTARAVELETAMKMSAAYRIYSGAAHAELYSIMQTWRRTIPNQSAPLERWNDRETVWAATLLGAGFVMMPTFWALVLLGLRARMKEMVRSMHAIEAMTRRMRLPEVWGT